MKPEQGKKPLLSQTTARDDLIAQWEDVDKFTAVLQLSLLIAAAVVFIYLFIILYIIFFSPAPPGLAEAEQRPADHQMDGCQTATTTSSPSLKEHLGSLD